MCTESGLKGGGPSPESQTNLHFHNYICIYIMATESWSVIFDPGSLLLSFWFFTASWEKKEKKNIILSFSWHVLSRHNKARVM